MLEQLDEYKDHVPGNRSDDEQPITKNDFLEASVFQNLPPILNDCCRVFSDDIEKNLVFLGAMTVLSGCLPNVYGVYDKDKIGANFFFFVVAPASSGKGCLKWAKRIAQSIHKSKRDKYEELKKEYLEAEDKEGLAHPKQYLHYIPANSSASALIEVLENNDGRGTLFCSEADTLSGALKQDWGNFSDILRSAFHHEPINFLRRKNDEYKEIETPYLSILLSGTPKQVHTLIPDPENGLMSRFAFFAFRSRPVMKNVFADNHVNFDEHFDHIQQRVERLYNYLNELSQPIYFSLTKEQEPDFLEMFSEGHTEFHLNLGEESLASIRRLGVIMFRLCVILTALRIDINASHPTQITCSDQDYQTAKSIIETLKKHTTKIFREIQKDSHKNIKLSDDKFRLYKALPETEFKRKEGVEICKKIGLSEATLDRLFKTEYIKSVPGFGKYKKTN